MSLKEITRSYIRLLPRCSNLHEKGVYVSILIALLEANGFCSFMQDIAAEILRPSSL